MNKSSQYELPYVWIIGSVVAALSVFFMSENESLLLVSIALRRL